MICAVMTFTFFACSDTKLDTSLEPSSNLEPSSDDTNTTAHNKIDEVFPKVKRYETYQYYLTLSSVKIVENNADSRAKKALLSLLAERKIAVDDAAKITINLGEYSNGTAENEAYIIDTTENSITLSSKGAAGQYYAVKTFSNLLDENKMCGIKIEDSPETPTRGTIEGFYGKPWSHEDRLSIIKFSGDYKLNMYIYAPKDDLKHREKWRELYTETEKTKLLQLINTASENFVDYVYALSPGLDFDFSPAKYDSELKLLVEKYDSIYNLGVRSFALFLDDIPHRTKADAANHARLVNDFKKAFFSKHDDLKPLISVFVEYFDEYITNDYTKTIAASLDKDVLVMWTGKGVVTISLSASSFSKPNAIYDRKMFLWWNYPVNDYVPNNLLLDGVRGLNKNINNAISGFVSNPMNQAETSKIPLFTLADYLWNPQEYSYSTSWEAAFKQLHPKTSESTKAFSTILNGSIINNYTDSLDFVKFVKDFDGKDQKDIDALAEKFANMKKAAQDIKTNEVNKKFLAEISPWLEKYELYADMGSLYMKLCTEKDDNEYMHMLGQFVQLNEKSLTLEAIVSGEVLTPFFKNAQAILTRLKPIEDNTKFLEAKVTTSLPKYQIFDTSNINDGNLQSYFWSAATPGEVSDGGSFTLDFGSEKDVKNIFIAMGEHDYDGDRFYTATIEYSSDGEKYQTVYSGIIDAVYFADNLDFKARYVRLRSNAKTNYWVKLREFEVNTNRKIENKIIKKEEDIKISATLPPYLKNTIDLAIDGNSNTFYWSKSSATSGFNVTLDLGKNKDVFNINFESGVLTASNDYIRKGVMQYSSDGNTWTDLGVYTSRNIFISGININCRYIRYLSQSVQEFWLSLASFSVNEAIISDTSYGTPAGKKNKEAYKLIDNT
ncbi:MAG: beta-N-acetylglucosaminidase domain-containing protein, partial [Clostridia bacterium]